MFEHVGQPHYREYFRGVHDRLKPDGVALVHTIGRTDPPSITSPWIDKYIFPGGYIPSMSEAMAAVEKEDLYPCDVEVWRLHYAETLRHWHDRFTARRDEAVALYDERFFRMWRYYLGRRGTDVPIQPPVRLPVPARPRPGGGAADAGLSLSGRPRGAADGGGVALLNEAGPAGFRRTSVR